MDRETWCDTCPSTSECVDQSDPCLRTVRETIARLDYLERTLSDLDEQVHKARVEASNAYGCAVRYNNRTMRRVDGLSKRTRVIQQTYLPFPDYDHIMTHSVTERSIGDLWRVLRAVMEQLNLRMPDEPSPLDDEDCPHFFWPNGTVCLWCGRDDTESVEKPPWPECQECDTPSPEFDCPPCEVWTERRERLRRAGEKLSEWMHPNGVVKRLCPDCGHVHFSGGMCSDPECHCGYEPDPSDEGPSVVDGVPAPEGEGDPCTHPENVGGLCDAGECNLYDDTVDRDPGTDDCRWAKPIAVGEHVGTVHGHPIHAPPAHLDGRERSVLSDARPGRGVIVTEGYASPPTGPSWSEQASWKDHCPCEEYDAELYPGVPRPAWCRGHDPPGCQGGQERSFLCYGRGLSYPSAHCAPPVGDREDGHRCEGCPYLEAGAQPSDAPSGTALPASREVP